MKKDYEKMFWKSYSENHFWKLNDKTKVKENSVYYDAIYNTLLPENKSTKILDVGSGGGHFLAYLKRRGYKNIEGVDLSPGLVEFVKKEIHPKVTNEDALSFLEKHKNEYDILVANDIIEHLHKDRIIEFLFLCYEALKKNGTLYLKTPNMGNFFAPRNRYVDFTHTTGFTEYSLNQVCAAVGFKDVKVIAENHTKKEPRIYRWIKKLYRLTGQDAPSILDVNILAICKK